MPFVYESFVGNMKPLIYFIIIHGAIGSAYSFIDLSYFSTYVSNLVDDKGDDWPESRIPKEMCDENQIMLQLAKIYIISPERVLILLTSDSLQETCKDISKAMVKINKTQSGCIPLSSENLYMKLLKTLKFFDASFCQSDSRLKKKINQIGDCLSELREEFLDCEGSPDWYENMNDTIRCHVLNDITNCIYVRTAMLCGLEPAAVIRGFTSELLQQAFPQSVRYQDRYPRFRIPC
ncbi:uncharacterized protein LOC129945009 isoform X2 [Eupeodes corollae]|uniref:uncharacterized protein LOC129945009 isoform X2 n=1 Tax=Eupeodes corollae TaxID=290404 RepID=UPI00249131A5|nr:uncharacterized protein LOC129945009 isoform X2 [Eupeodes corollae]